MMNYTFMIMQDFLVKLRHEVCLQFYSNFWREIQNSKFKISREIIP